jgi:1L-myo-inositol 1-phosphate cytidylyltransferase
MTIIDQCLILAAGNGSRIASIAGGVPKPLVELCGAPLLEHVMACSREAGIKKFVIVAGYRAESLRGWLASRPIEGISATVIENLAYHKGNGVSVLAARKALDEPFLLLMADHVFQFETARALLRQSCASDEVILAVDRKLDAVFDLDDATKVRCEGRNIAEIGKQLVHYDALDTGMFLCSPALFDRLETAKRDDDCSLSDGMRKLAQDGRLMAFDIGDARWHDVDSPEALAHAEEHFERDFPTHPLARRLVRA